MSRRERLSESAELTRWVRDLIALSTFPSMWIGLPPPQICDKAAAALVPMLDVELVFILLPASLCAIAVEVAHTRLGAIPIVAPALRLAFEEWRDDRSVRRAGRIANPLGAGFMNIAAAELEDALVIAGSTRPGFPSPSEQSLLDVASNELVVTVRRWKREGGLRRYQSVVERSSDLIGIADLEGTIKYINPAGLDLLGVSEMAAAKGRNIMEFVAEQDRETARSVAWPEVLRTGRWAGEIRLLRMDTLEPIPFAVEWFNVDEPRTGRPMSVATVSRDLRQQRRVESELRARNETLEQRLQQEMADVARIKLETDGLRERPFSERNLPATIARPGTSLDVYHTGAEPILVRARDAVAGLTTRERQVLMMLADGKPQKIIAHELGISVRTVEVHRARMLRRLGAPHLAHAIRMAAWAELAAMPDRI